MEIVYKNFIELLNWDKNETIRTISPDNYQKLLHAIRKEGIKEAFKIGADGTVYDGNNRLKGIRELIATGTTKAENGVDLTMVPCIVYTPQTEGQKADLALSGNEQFASWNREGLMEYLPEIETELDMSMYNVDFFEPESVMEQIETVDDAANSPDSSKEAKEIVCPSCGNSFVPVK